MTHSASITIENLNKIIKSELWIDFYVAEFSRDLKIIGTLNFIGDENLLEIYLRNIVYIQGQLDWQTDTKKEEIIKIFDPNDIKSIIPLSDFHSSDKMIIGFQKENSFSTNKWIYFVAESIDYIYHSK